MSTVELPPLYVTIRIGCMECSRPSEPLYVGGDQAEAFARWREAADVGVEAALFDPWAQDWPESAVALRLYGDHGVAVFRWPVASEAVDDPEAAEETVIARDTARGVGPAVGGGRR